MSNWNANVRLFIDGQDKLKADGNDGVNQVVTQLAERDQYLFEQLNSYSDKTILLSYNQAIDLSPLKEFFEETPNKNIVAEELKSELQKKIEDLVKKNKTRAKFLDRLNTLISEYNAGARNLDDFFTELVELANSLTEEQSRAVQEGMTEEELAIFDLLKKDPLNPEEVAKVKLVAHDLLAKLKNDLLTLEWRTKYDTRAVVKVAIADLLIDELPSPYTEEECEERAEKVYMHVYDSYLDKDQSVYNVTHN